jgi:hypothetical protein
MVSQAPAFARVPGQGMPEFAARADLELGEHLAEVVLDGARAEEQPGCDLRVGQPVPGEPGYLGLLGGQFVTSVSRVPGTSGQSPSGLPGSAQLAASTVGECVHADGIEHGVSRAQLVTRFAAAACAAQPFSEQQVRTGQVGAQAGTGQPGDRLLVKDLRGRAVAQQRT